MLTHFRPLHAAAVVGLTAAAALSAATAVNAATAIMIWPIDPAVESDQRATALWLENRDKEPVTLQTRIVAWHQRDNTESHDPDQNAIAISPPLVTVQPGARQLIRLIRLADAAPGSEEAYRVLIDEIPQPDDDTSGSQDKMAIGVKFQMHYSLPLFVYGKGLRGKPVAGAGRNATGAAGPALSWSIATAGGERWLVLTNRGPVHARLTRLSYLDAGKRVDSDLLGYVLPGAYMRWKVPAEVGATSDLHMLATVDGKNDVAISPDAKP